MKIEVEILHLVVRDGQIKRDRSGVRHTLANQTTVYEVTVDNEEGVWKETLLSVRELTVFSQGLEAAAALLGHPASIHYKHVGGSA